MGFYKNVSLVFKLYSYLKESMLSYALKYRNTFNETLECNREYEYISLGILKKKENKKILFKKRNKVKSPYNIIRDAYQVPYAHY